jgi:hypothetical protein
MITGLRMERNIGRSGIGKIGNNPIHRFYHQMDVYGCLDTMAAQGLANHGAYRQIWNVMVVHNIKMHHVGAGCDHSFDVFTQLCKVG